MTYNYYNVPDHSHSYSWSGNHSHTFAPPTLTGTFMSFKEEKQEMSTAQLIANERKEKRERARLEKQYEAWDDRDIEATIPDGGGWTFFRMDGKTKVKYALLRADTEEGKVRWYLTGTGTSRLNSVSTEDLLAWLVARDLAPTAVFGPLA